MLLITVLCSISEASGVAGFHVYFWVFAWRGTENKNVRGGELAAV